MFKRRPAYIRDKIALEAARREARRTHPGGCECPLCWTSATLDRLTRAALDRNPGRGEEVPF